MAHTLHVCISWLLTLSWHWRCIADVEIGELAGLWLIDFESPLTTWSMNYEEPGPRSKWIAVTIALDGSVSLSDHAKTVELMLERTGSMGDIGVFTHVLKVYDYSESYELFLKLQHGKLIVERRYPNHFLRGVGRRQALPMEIRRPLSTEFLESTCNASLLPQGCRGVPWVEDFLEVSCGTCRNSACSNRYSIIRKAEEIAAMRSPDDCRIAFASAMVVHMQFGFGIPDHSKDRYKEIMKLDVPAGQQGFAKWEGDADCFPSEDWLGHMPLRDCADKCANKSFIHATNGDTNCKCLVDGCTEFSDDRWGLVTYRRHNEGPSLEPFPFWVEHADLYEHFVPITSDPPCIGELGSDARMPIRSSSGKQQWAVWYADIPLYAPLTRPALLPREVDLAQVDCPFVASDATLQSKCRSRAQQVRFGADHDLGDVIPLKWHCPENGTAGAGGDKYEKQVWRSCSSGHGTWGKQIAGRLKCIAIVVAELLQLRPGQRVLDWGSGCGWTLTWLRNLYGVEGYGIDAASANFHWSKQHSAGEFCLWSSFDLTWVPDAGFDAVIAYWALYHHMEPAQCHLARQLIAKLKPGGRAWFGGNSPSTAVGISVVSRMTKHAWRRCLRAAAGDSKHGRGREVHLVLDLEFFLDVQLFTASGVQRAETYERPGDYLFWPPVYSVVVRKLA
jgi:hypothetical protein